MIVEKIKNEVGREFLRLADTLPKAEKNLDYGMRQTIKEAIDLNMSIPKPTANETYSLRETKTNALMFAKAVDIVAYFTPLQNIGTNVATPAIEALDAMMNRPGRVREYAKKFISILPSEFLIHFYKNLLVLGFEKTIRRIELQKGEADQKDFFGEPSGFDPSFFAAEKN